MKSSIITRPRKAGISPRSLVLLAGGIFIVGGVGLGLLIAHHKGTTTPDSQFMNATSATVAQGSSSVNNSAIASSSDGSNPPVPSQCATPSSVMTQSISGSSAVIVVNDPSGDTLSLTATGGTLSRTSVNGTANVTVTAQRGSLSTTVTAVDTTNSACGKVHDKITWQTGAIKSVQWQLGTFPPGLIVSGSGFGNTSNKLSIVDQTKSWQTTFTGTGVVPEIYSWWDGQITVAGFGNYGSLGPQGQKGLAFAPGDKLVISVTNSDGQSLSYNTTYPANAPMPTVKLQPLGTATTNSQLTIQGHVSFGGKPLANQMVVMSSDIGKLELGQNRVTITDAQGNFTVPYTAPNKAGTAHFTAVLDGSTAHGTMTVFEPKNRAVPSKKKTTSPVAKKTTPPISKPTASTIVKPTTATNSNNK